MNDLADQQGVLKNRQLVEDLEFLLWSCFDFEWSLVDKNFEVRFEGFECSVLL